MDDEAKIQQAVSAAMEQVRARLPALAGAAPVHEIRFEMGTDLLGQPKADITVVLVDQPSGELYPGERLWPIRDMIWDVFNERAPGAWPVTRFLLQSELDEIADEDDDEDFDLAAGGP